MGKQEFDNDLKFVISIYKNLWACVDYASEKMKEVVKK